MMQWRVCEGEWHSATLWDSIQENQRSHSGRKKVNNYKCKLGSDRNAWLTLMGASSRRAFLTLGSENDRKSVIQNVCPLGKTGDVCKCKRNFAILSELHATRKQKKFTSTIENSLHPSGLTICFEHYCHIYPTFLGFLGLNETKRLPTICSVFDVPHSPTCAYMKAFIHFLKDWGARAKVHAKIPAYYGMNTQEQ